MRGIGDAIQYRQNGQPVPDFLSFEAMALETIMNDTTMRRLGYTAEEIGKMPKWKVELYARVARRTGMT